IILILSTIDIFYNILIRDIIDAATSGKTYTEKMIIIFIVLGFYFIILIIYNYLKSFFIKKTMTSMKSRYLKKVFNKNINEFQKENTALYLSSLTNDYNRIETNFLQPIIDMIFGIATFIAGIFIFVIVNPLILLIAFGLMIINFIISYVSSKPVNRHNKERSDMFASFTSFIKEVLSAFHIIKTNNLDEKVTNDYYDKSNKIQYKGYKIDLIQSFVFAIQNANFFITFIGLIIVVGYMSIIGIISFGSVVLIVQSSEKIIWPIQMFSEALPKIFSVKSIFKRIDNSLKNVDDYEETIDFDGFKNQLEFKNVSFSYDENLILDNVNLNLKKGGKYLIVGPSGGGKSTFLKLLRKYFYPQSGNIIIDGKDLKDIKKESYFAHIANVEQNVFLFEDTLKNNLTLYKDYNEEELFSVIEKAGLKDFLKGLENGLETKIYENGKNISGGEKSRIAIARGLLNKADIIFFDEAFASLDMEIAKAIERSILNLENITIINVSHVVFKENQDLYDKVFVVNDKIIKEI
ncbi:MAG TPA: ABC transporter ATP-binding protein, partial [Acholeplasmataceae bacterium]|nr:ABC transporter ATP-binding protein [Acholeplasmataceae bacterium]